MGKTQRDKNKFSIPNTLNPQAHIKAAEDAKGKKSKGKRPEVRKNKIK